MTHGWKQTYAKLEGYIAANPEIKISKGITVLPDSNREEFYRLFDNVRLAFLKERSPEIFEGAHRLSQAYLAEVGELKKSLKIAEVETPPRLNWVLKNPPEGLSRGLFDALFNLLKGGKSIEEFERDAEAEIKAFWKPLDKQGYEDWVILSLTNMLSPERILAPSWDEIVGACHELQPDEKRGWAEEMVPNPEEIQTIELGHEGASPAFVVPDIILLSRKAKKYISFGANLTDTSWHAKNASEQREWITLRRRGLESRPRLNWPGIVVFTDNEPSEISIVADFSRFLRPEIMIECMEQEDWFQRGYLDKIKSRHAFFKPTLGTFIISRFPAPAEAFQALEPVESTTLAAESETVAEIAQTPETAVEPSSQNIFIISAAGYNREALNPIINALLAAEEKDEEKE